jgi:hypothetical protein
VGFQIADRLSFQRFVGIDLTHAVTKRQQSWSAARSKIRTRVDVWPAWF